MHRDHLIPMRPETIDSYGTQIRQVAMLLGSGEPQVLGGIHRHASKKIILDIVSNRRPETSSRKQQKEYYLRKVR